MGFADAYAGPFALPDLRGDAPDWRDVLADQLYGPVPPPPKALGITRRPISGTSAERVTLTILANGGTLTVDAALWLPPDTTAKPPIVCGLDFVGPAGILPCDSFPLDPDAVVLARPELGAPDGRLTPTMRGTSAAAWPIPLLLGAGFGVLVSCYGSWVPDCPDRHRDHGLVPVLASPFAGAISLWAWALMRLVDVAMPLSSACWVAGHSRLGKAALWAAANDPRIAGVFANQSGAGGAAPAAHPVGETLAQMAQRFPHWLHQTTDFTRPLECDQHQLLAAIAPRPTYLSGAKGDIWADPMGTYQMLRMARPHHDAPTPQALWDTPSQVLDHTTGFHLREGDHALLPYDWQAFLRFATRHALHG